MPGTEKKGGSWMSKIEKKMTGTEKKMVSKCQELKKRWLLYARN